MSRFAVGAISAEVIYRMREEFPSPPVMAFLRKLAIRRGRDGSDHPFSGMESWGAVVVVMVDFDQVSEVQERIEAALRGNLHAVDRRFGPDHDPRFLCQCGGSGDRQWMVEHLRSAGQSVAP